jgi:4,5-dihydroxyphthalate decarboxylase
VADRSLNDMLVGGELDALIAAHPPAAFESGQAVRLFSDYRAAEEAYYRDTGIFPIMHVVVLRREIQEAHPWVAMNLLTAFREAKRRSTTRAGDMNASRYPVPWGQATAERAAKTFGGDMWPYGVDENRETLEAFLGFAHEQGVCARRLTVDDLFPEQVKTGFRI